MTCLKLSIDEIFATRSIYKSLLVCHDDKITEELVDELKRDNYPVSTLTKIEDYLKNETRVLAIDYIDYCNLQLFVDQDTIDQISLVIFINGKSGVLNHLDTINKNCEFVHLHL